MYVAHSSVSPIQNDCDNYDTMALCFTVNELLNSYIYFYVEENRRQF